ncbi:MAG: M20/M25/M40 family metallo-hydrolase [Candidatus Pacearchaeota archaeon]|nr:M20/M25/M40 family metallo-hydrolase [Candidatus Pacearchaeota archaeon]
MVLQNLINLKGISGDENGVRKFIIKESKKYLKNIKVDHMGNIIAIKPGKKPAVMFMAHMDEIGLMISSISKKGWLSVSPIGGIDPYILLGQKIYIEGKRGKKIGGIVTTPNILDSADLEKNLKMDDLFVYTGLTKKEILNLGVDVGSYASFSESSDYCHLNEGDIIAGKALDDRIGCFILLELMKNIKTESEVIFVFTVQEEVGLYGAKASVFNLNPDYAIAIDVTPHNEFDESIMLRNGPVLTIKDAEMLAHRLLVDEIKKAAKKAKVKIQLEVSESGTTDATSVFAAKGGIPSAVFGVAVGNLHTPVGIASRRDIKEAIKVLQVFLKDPPKKEY